MKILSPIFNQASGKLGNAIAARARGGILYLRARVIPSNPQTFLQTAVRNAITTVAGYWRATLNQTQRETWAETGESTATGETNFLRVNQPRIYAVNSGRTALLDADKPDIIVAPPASFSTQFTFPEITIDDSSNNLVVDSFAATDECFVGKTTSTPAIVYIFVSPQQSASRFARQHPYQLVSAQVFGTDGDPTAGCTVDLAALGLPTVAGNVMYVKMYAQAPGGGMSQPVEQRVTIVA